MRNKIKYIFGTILAGLIAVFSMPLSTVFARTGVHIHSGGTGGFGGSAFRSYGGGSHYYANNHYYGHGGGIFFLGGTIGNIFAIIVVSIIVLSFISVFVQNYRAKKQYREESRKRADKHTYDNSSVIDDMQSQDEDIDIDFSPRQLFDALPYNMKRHYDDINADDLKQAINKYVNKDPNEEVDFFDDDDRKMNNREVKRLLKPYADQWARKHPDKDYFD